MASELKAPVFWLFAEAKVQEAVRVFVLHQWKPKENYPPTPEQFEVLRRYLNEWLTPFENLESLKARVAKAETVADVAAVVRVMCEAGADPF